MYLNFFGITHLLQSAFKDLTNNHKAQIFTVYNVKLQTFILENQDERVV